MVVDINGLITQATEFFILYGLKIVVALAILLVGKWLAKGVSNFAARQMAAASVDPTVAQFGKNILFYLLFTIVVIAALSHLGIQTASFVAVMGAAGLAVGLALQGSLSNFAAGVLLILFRPIKVGDFVEVAGVSGTVKDISIFCTVLHSGDNKTITVANASVTGSNIVNFSTQDTRRIDLVVGVGYSAKLEQVKTELQALADADPRILKDVGVTIGVSELADSSVNLVFRPWVKSSDYWPVRFDLNEKIKTRFNELGIEIPYPKLDVNLNQID